MAPDAPGALDIAGLHFSYGKLPILRGLSFSAEPGRICALFGPNGSGKTTLFRCCLGLLSPDAGGIRIGGVDIRGLSVAERARRIAYVPQEHRPSFPFLVREVVSMGRTPHMGGFFRLSRRDMLRTEEALDQAGIRHLAGEPCTSLSGGQRQLVYLARALAQEAPLMLLDEPTSALDFSNQLSVWHTLRRIAETGVTVVVCCHDPNYIFWFCHYAVILSKGRLLASGPSRETLTQAVLRELYGDSLELTMNDGCPMVRPRLDDGRR